MLMLLKPLVFWINTYDSSVQRLHLKTAACMILCVYVYIYIMWAQDGVLLKNVMKVRTWEV